MFVGSKMYVCGKNCVGSKVYVCDKICVGLEIVCLNFVYNFWSKRFHSSKCLAGYRDVNRNACKVSITVARAYG